MGLFSKQPKQNFLDMIEKRRSIYDLKPASPISDQEIEDIIAKVIKHTPSAFNSQSTRIVLLLNDNHKQLWDLTTESLKEIMGDADFTDTQQKMDMFKNAYGTVLFFEDKNVVKGLQEQFPIFADGFPTWAQHANAMHQFNVWTAFAEKNLGASLQHYNGVIDEKVYSTYGISKDWELVAQMPFGEIGTPAGAKEVQPINERFIVKK
ncbi:nitroreductase family protein [Facklamia sp. 7083-14-GEN3]|uniref:nitroreductase family protein n=1 Tax=Facklamia sp. 7083-14-GEN3 TaxID=2973478 RepID=UPI00215B88C0|nr:nitroreductase family protein [Facklamia sp. 7083-14-GEN3]MCR8969068.1 nitroreductase family protein [Facklamia sp. 7083-14-GEN3]